jgi:PAS domain S-box-containing protein
MGIDIMNRSARINQLSPQAKAFATIGINMRTPVAIADQVGRLVWMNQAFEDMTGYSFDEMYGKKPKDFLQGIESNTDEIQKLSIALQQKEYVEASLYNYRKNGEKYLVELQITPVFDYENVFTHFVAVQRHVEDTSESRNELQYNLKQQELLAEIALDLNNYVEFDKSIQVILEALLQHTQVSRIYIFENTPDGLGCRNSFEVCNVGVEPQIDMLQYTPYEVISSWPKALKEHGIIFTEDIKTLPQDAQDILEPQDIKSILVLPLIVNGEYFGFIGFDECAVYKKWKRSDIELLRAISGIIGNAFEREITRKNLVAKNDDLNKINSELDKFVYSVSHDLRAPLLSIKGILNLVLKTASLDAKTSHLLRLAEQSASRLDETIHEILDYSRNARLGLTLEEFDLSILIDQIHQDLKYYSSKEVKFVKESANEQTLVYSDKSRTNTLLKNIIGNAYKYLKKDAFDSVVHVHYQINENEFDVVVTDNGEGVSAEHQARIFEMFYRASKSGATGSGLGLYICQEILDKMGGRISLESTEDVGTTVRITVPMGERNSIEQLVYTES